MNFKLLLLFFFLFLSGLVKAQRLEPGIFDHYTTASGLSDNWVTSIAQDSTGYVWLGTTYGLNRFDGSRFVQYHSNNENGSLASEDINGHTWLNKKDLALFASSLHIVDTKKGTVRNLFVPYHNKKYQFKFNMIERAMGDDKGNIYILSRSGFYHYDENDTLVFRFDYYNEQAGAVSHFYFGRGLFQLNDKMLLIVSINGLYVYDKEKKECRKMEAADCLVMAEFINYPKVDYHFFQPNPGEFFILKTASDTLVYINAKQNSKVVSKLPFAQTGSEIAWRSKLIKHSDTLFYVTGQVSGFYKLGFQPQTGKATLYPQKYFSAYACNALMVDRDKSLWVATTRGLFRQNTRASSVQVALLPEGIENRFPNIKIGDVHISSGKIYAGTREGGLFIFDKATLKFEKQILSPGDRKLNYIRGIAGVDASTLILGTHGALLLFDTKTNKERKIIPPQWNEPTDWTARLYKARNGDVWISSHNIYRFNTTSKSFQIIPSHPQLLDVPFAMAEDKDGNIWMTCHGIARYNTSLNRYDHFLDSFPYVKMPDKQVSAIVVDDENNLWFNSANNGLMNYDPAKGTYRHFTRGNGLPDDNISSLAIVGNKIWIACYSGIACIDTKNLHITSFGKEDGFPDMPVIKGGHFFYDEGSTQLYIAFASAIARFNPDSLLQKKEPPKIFIEDVVVNGERYFLPANAITTSWKKDELQISIGAIDFQQGRDHYFAYRIVKDSSTPWIEMGMQPAFSISNLSPGTHRIQVKAYSPDSRWQEQVKELTIEVSPPLWKEDWFLAICGLVALATIYLLIKWRTTAARKKEMEKTHIEKLKVDHYKNQFELEQISNYFSSSLTGKKTEDEVLWDVASNLIGRMNYEDCIIYLWNEDKTKMVQKAAYGPKGKPEVISADAFEVAPGQGIVGHVIETKQPVLINDTRTDNRYRVDDEFRLSEVAVPIIHNDELLGVIDSENSAANYFSERDIKILTTIATLIGNKLKQIESEQSLEAKQKELAGINEQLAEARLSALQAQMNPHFVFNALNSIKRMILDADNEKASRYLSKFALMIRMTLEHSKEIFVSLDDNVEYLKAYLDMEQLRFGDCFRYVIDIDDALDVEDVNIPSLMMQPLVENAIWHGLMQANGDKKIVITFKKQDQKLICTVQDNGIGIRRSENLRNKQRPLHRSVGLQNMQKRIRIINEKYSTDCALHLEDLQETGIESSGTRAVLQLNLLTTYQKL